MHIIRMLRDLNVCVMTDQSSPVSLAASGDAREKDDSAVSSSQCGATGAAVEVIEPPRLPPGVARIKPQ